MKTRLPKKHISLYNSESVKSICQPLFSKTPLNYFHYAKLYHDGRSSILVTHPEFHQHFWTMKYDQEIFSQYQPGVFFNENYANQALLDARDFNCDNLMMFINMQSDHLEVIGFAAKTEDKTTPAFYLRQMESLKRFCSYFKEKASKLIIEADKNLLFTENYQPLYLNKEQTSNHFSFEQLLNDLFPDKFKNLTKTELICLQHLLKGKTSKMIGEEIKISFRTVEHHIENLKIKLNVRYRTQLIKLFRGLF